MGLTSPTRLLHDEEMVASTLERIANYLDDDLTDPHSRAMAAQMLRNVAEDQRKPVFLPSKAMR